MLDQADWGVFKRSETWKAFGVAVVLFGVIAYAGLSLFDSMDEIFESDAEPAPIPEIIIQSLNRTGIEENYTNSDGEIRLSEMRGDVIILDLMAHDCSNCHAVQAHLENNMDDWKATADANGVGFHILHSSIVPNRTRLNRSGDSRERFYNRPEEVVHNRRNGPNSCCFGHRRRRLHR